VHIVKNEQHAAYFPDGKVGDLLISLRNLNTIALLDRDTSAMKWHVTGLFKEQHEPILTNRGTVIVFDNLGGDPPNGVSRLVEIDIASRKTVGTYEATGDDFFQSDIRGKTVMLDDHRILVQEENPIETGHPATMFILDCPGRYLSNDCVKQTIFSGKAKEFRYENAMILGKKL